jgi:hypothetical protein
MTTRPYPTPRGPALLVSALAPPSAALPWRTTAAQGAAREERVGRRRDHGAPRAVLAREALVVDRLQAPQMVQHQPKARRRLGASGLVDAASAWRGPAMRAADGHLRKLAALAMMRAPAAEAGVEAGGSKSRVSRKISVYGSLRAQQIRAARLVRRRIRCSRASQCCARGNQLPLRIDLRASAQCEAIKARVRAQIREDWLHLGKAPRVLSATRWCIDAIAERMIQPVPASMGPYLAVVTGVLSVPFTFLIGTMPSTSGSFPFSRKPARPMAFPPPKWRALGSTLVLLAIGLVTMVIPLVGRGG